MFCIYRPLKIDTKRKIHPDIIKGLGSISLDSENEFYIGLINEPNELTNLERFEYYLISKDLKDGFILMNANFKLSSKERNKVKKAKLFLEKLSVRRKIRCEVGDLEDIVADSNKKINILFNMILLIMENADTNTKNKFNDVFGNILDEKFIKETKIDKDLITKLLNRDKKIDDIMKEYKK